MVQRRCTICWAHEATSRTEETDEDREGSAPEGEHTDSRKRLAAANRAALIELATERFATEGYAQTSMRDLERDGPVTLAAIYSHFRNKAELLVAAIDQRIVEDLEDVPEEMRGADLVTRLSNNARTYPERRALRALLVQAAASSQTDPETKQRVRDAQKRHLDDWSAAYHANRERIGLDPDVDVDTAIRFNWAAELGLGILEAFDLAPDPQHWTEMQARVARSLLDRTRATGGTTSPLAQDGAGTPRSAQITGYSAAP